MTSIDKQIKELKEEIERYRVLQSRTTIRPLLNYYQGCIDTLEMQLLELRERT